MKLIDLYVVTFNCARELVRPEIFALHLFDARPSIQNNTSPPPEILVLSLQEIAPIAYSFLGGSYLEPYFDRFRQAIQLVASRVGNGESGYRNVLTRNVGMTALMVFVRHDSINAVKHMETAGVGVGLLDMGNKGAVGARLEYSTGGSDKEAMVLTFVALHLAAAESGVERRNKDWMNIVQRLVFTPTDNSIATRQTSQSTIETSEEVPLLASSSDEYTMSGSGLYKATTHLFVAGDFNYRTSEVKPGPENHHSYPQPTKDRSDPKHYSQLLAEDQLTRELKAGATCHGLKEEPINFPPTYKYSTAQRVAAETNSQSKWNWAKHRWPSWCDRVLYLDLPPWRQGPLRSNTIRFHGYTALPVLSTSDHRPVALSCALPLAAIPPPALGYEGADPRLNPPYPVDPTWRERRAWARKTEIIVGILSYLGLTWEGRGVLLATLIGGVGGWMVIRSLLVL